MAATVTKPEVRRRGAGATGTPSVRTAIDAFLDSPKVVGNPNTSRAHRVVGRGETRDLEP